MAKIVLALTLLGALGAAATLSAKADPSLDAPPPIASQGICSYGC